MKGKVIGTPYTASSATVPISVRTTEYGISRNGVISDLNLDIGDHFVKLGFWTEDSNHLLTRNFYAVTDGSDTNYFLTNPFATGFKQKFDTQTTQFYLQDTLELGSSHLTLV